MVLVSPSSNTCLRITSIGHSWISSESPPIHLYSVAPPLSSAVNLTFIGPCIIAIVEE